MSATILAIDPHLAWWTEADRLMRIMDRPGLPQGKFDAALERHTSLLERIATTPARTLSGALAQIRVVRIGIEAGEADFDADAIANAIATLERLARQPQPLAVA